MRMVFQKVDLEQMYRRGEIMGIGCNSKSLILTGA